MAQATQGAYIYRQGTSPQTETVISTRFKIFTDLVDVGAFVKLGVTSSFTYTEAKTIDAVRGLGLRRSGRRTRARRHHAVEHQHHAHGAVPREPHAGSRLQGWHVRRSPLSQAPPLAI